MLEIKGEVIYKTLAYRKAADSLTKLGREAKEYWQEGKLNEIPGVGKAIAEKIDELFTTGKLVFLEKLEKEVPPSLRDLLKVPDVGPKKVALLAAAFAAGASGYFVKGSLRALPSSIRAVIRSARDTAESNILAQA